MRSIRRQAGYDVGAIVPHNWKECHDTKANPDERGQIMIRETEYFLTQQGAESWGQHFVEYWGRAYCPSYTVGYDTIKGIWACYLSRWTSCD